MNTLANRRQNFSKEWSKAQNSRKLLCKAGPVLWELSDSEGWRALEERGENRSVGRATNVRIGQRREQCERRNYSREEKRQNRQPIRAVPGVAMRNQQAHKRDSDCDCRNQEPSAPLPVLNHR
jgi:hypothetical protein